MLCETSARYFSGSVVEADGAGVFAFCGGTRPWVRSWAMSRIEDFDADPGEAPAVPR